MRASNFSSWLGRKTRLLVLISLTLVAYTAAINSAQTLPWAIAALLLSTLLIGYFWPRWLVKRLSATRQGPVRAEEQQTITFQVTVENHGWLPRFMVELQDRLPFYEKSSGDGAEGETLLGVFPYIPGRKTSHFEVALLCEKRGYYELGPVVLASGFPLGLAQARHKDNGGVQSLTVYPDIFPILSMPLMGAPSQIHREDICSLKAQVRQSFPAYGNTAEETIRVMCTGPQRQGLMN